MSSSQIDSDIADGQVPAGISAGYLKQSRDEATITAMSVIFGFTTIVVAIRITARRFILNRVGLDDYLAIFAWVLLAAFIGLCYKLILIGSGRHYAYIQYVMAPAVVDQSEVLDFVAHIIYTTSLLFCRLSGLALYEVLVRQHSTYRRAVIAIAIFIIVSYIPQLFLIIFHCLPVTGLWPYSWQPQANTFECLSWGVVYSVNSAVSLCNDLLLYGIPVVLIWRLQLSRKRRIVLACILCPGILVIAISTARLILVIRGQWLADESWQYDPQLAVEVSEISFTLISLSLPGCKPLWDRLFSSSTKPHNSHTYTADTKDTSQWQRSRITAHSDDSRRGSSQEGLRMTSTMRSNETLQRDPSDMILVTRDFSVQETDGDSGVLGTIDGRANGWPLRSR